VPGEKKIPLEVGEGVGSGESGGPGVRVITISTTGLEDGAGGRVPPTGSEDEPGGRGDSVGHDETVEVTVIVTTPPSEGTGMEGFGGDELGEPINGAGEL